MYIGINTIKVCIKLRLCYHKVHSFMHLFTIYSSITQTFNEHLLCFQHRTEFWRCQISIKVFQYAAQPVWNYVSQKPWSRWPRESPFFGWFPIHILSLTSFLKENFLTLLAAVCILEKLINWFKWCQFRGLFKYHGECCNSWPKSKLNISY